MKKTDYSVTIGYKAVITISVTAENEEEAKRMALEEMESVRSKFSKNKYLSLETDSFGAYGITNMDKTWNQHET